MCAAGQSSGDVAGAEGGCADGNSKDAECLPFVDIFGVSWGTKGDELPRLLVVSVTLAGAPPPDSFADYIVTVSGTGGSGTPIIQEQIRALTEGLSCESFRGDGPGETCSVPAADQFEITVDVGELMFPLVIEVFSLTATPEGRLGDHYLVEDIGE